MVAKIISGGQTGADRAGLDAGRFLGYEVGGYVPKGRRSEDGPVPDSYPMIELPTADYAVRTRRNIAASGATIILIQHDRDMRGGTKMTYDMVDESKYCIGVVVRIHEPGAAVGLREFWRSIVRFGVSVVNIAGPRESKSPGIYRAAYELLVTNIPICQRRSNAGPVA